MPTSSWSAPAQAACPPPSPPPTTACGSSSSSAPTCAAGRPRGPAAGCGPRATRSPSADGVHEDVEAFRTYLRAALGRRLRRRAASTRSSRRRREMVRFFHEQTALTFVPGAKICDVYGDLPGAGTGHRSVAPAPVDGRTLGDEVLRASCATSSTRPRSSAWASWPGPDLAAFLVRLPRQPPRPAARDPSRRPARLRPGHPPPRACSWSTAPRWSAGCCGRRCDLGVDVRVSHPGHRAAPRAGGRVTGVVATTPDGPLRVTGDPGRRARRRRVPARRRPPPCAVPADPDGRRALVAGPGRPPTARARRSGESAGGRLRTDVGVARRVVPGVARARTGRADRRVPAHHGPRQARAASACCPPAGASSTRPTATTTTSPP